MKSIINYIFNIISSLLALFCQAIIIFMVICLFLEIGISDSLVSFTSHDLLTALSHLFDGSSDEGGEDICIPSLNESELLELQEEKSFLQGLQVLLNRAYDLRTRKGLIIAAAAIGGLWALHHLGGPGKPPRKPPEENKTPPKVPPVPPAPKFPPRTS